MRFFRYLAVASLVGASAGCNDVLDVGNSNNPDRDRLLRTNADVEALSASQFQQVISGTLGNTARVQTGMLTAAFENASGLANNGLGPRSAMPRQAIDNNRGNAYATENFNDYRILSSTARATADVMVRSKNPGFTLTGGTNDINRLNAWNHFVYGVALGYLSMVYDSAAVPRPSDAPLAVQPLESYQAVNAYALAQFDSAIAYASRTGTTSLPSGWLTGPQGPAVTMPEFIRVVRSFRARMRAGVARNAQERGAVNWAAVIADGQNGITSDLQIRMDPAAGWDYQWLATTLHFRDANWHQMPYHIIGMADVSGAFDTWLSQPRDTRSFFTIVTPDLRFPRGATRAAQNRASADDDRPLPEGQYFRNRLAGKDQASTGWQASQYDHYRFRGFANDARIGLFPFFTRAENDMLVAEGMIRTGNIAGAATLIDRTRTASGLPALSGVVTSASEPVPGGSSCVPRVPQAPTFTTTACGTIFEAMKWEKRMETAYTTYGAWFFDSRGWNDLPVGTAVSWPVPVQELDARNMPLYNLGGVGKPGGATESTYGYGSGNR
jgi:hypothetical protein